MSTQTMRPAVLVVDDEPAVRAMTVDMFECLGVTVFEAYNGADALSLLSRHPEIGVLFSDVRMPGMTGVELARRAKELRPELRIVLTSGYVGVEATGMIPHDEFVPKPFRLEHLASIIEAAAPVVADAAAAASVAKRK